MYEGVCQYSMRECSGRPLLPLAPIWTRFVFGLGKSKVRRVSPWILQALGALFRKSSSMGLSWPPVEKDPAGGPLDWAGGNCPPLGS
jgi:hypothetical protein